MKRLNQLNFSIDKNTFYLEIFSILADQEVVEYFHMKLSKNDQILNQIDKNGVICGGSISIMY